MYKKKILLVKQIAKHIIGVKKMEEIGETLAIKRWWEFRTPPSLWVDFLKSKYCSRLHAVARKKGAKSISFIETHDEYQVQSGEVYPVENKKG